jgi:hypothetical protein
MKTLVLAAAVVLVVAFSIVQAGDEPWFDMENCSFCKNLATEPGLLDHMTWEQHNISNGMVSVTWVDEKYMDEYKTAYDNMEKVGKRLEAGEQLPMCQSCMTFGMLMMKGVKQESAKLTHGDVWIVTSDDPAVVKQIQDWATRNMEELKKAHTDHG